ncbi:(S)-2,3-di-O-geranylgeranylglyceryl phosphate synthase [Methanosarcina sp. MTP4]|uniref:UbiA family prenyltransferase n=1 Tax=Methanosarcina sp. MTP4 TaxID=1434100 RepID=UPI000615D709|nr:UbiA family prenyltransferase [Methanosarcina sp. MTP4]AKB25596.1 (S)-2,3-di-O-geranylgeranylglyceryl phosphate synthase [Methanosarcina sp. MTP4]
MFKTRMIGLFRLFRFELPFAAGVCVVLGELLALGELPTTTEIVLGFLSFFFISAAALILNDYFDVEIDRINAPERPLPAGLVTGQDVVLLSIAVTGLGFTTGYLISLEALLVVILVWAVGFLYNWRFKRAGFIGNLMVSFSVGMTFVFGGIATGRPFETIVWFFAVIVMLVDLGEEIAADAMDIEGDRQAGSRSLALVLGRENALKISGAIFLLVIVASILPFFLGWLELIYLFPILLMDAVILYSTSKLLDSRIVNRRIYIRWIYLSGLAAFLIFIIIRMLS